MGPRKNPGSAFGASADGRGYRADPLFETLTPGPKVDLDMSEQRVETDDVEHVAGLARVDLDEGDAERFVDQFADILEAFDALEDVPDVDRDVELTNVMRPDEERASLSQDDALANAPDSEDGYFKGPNVS